MRAQGGPLPRTPLFLVRPPSPPEWTSMCATARAAFNGCGSTAAGQSKNSGCYTAAAKPRSQRHPPALPLPDPLPNPSAHICSLRVAIGHTCAHALRNRARAATLPRQRDHAKCRGAVPPRLVHLAGAAARRPYARTAALPRQVYTDTSPRVVVRYRHDWSISQVPPPTHAL